MAASCPRVRAPAPIMTGDRAVGGGAIHRHLVDSRYVDSRYLDNIRRNKIIPAEKLTSTLTLHLFTYGAWDSSEALISYD